MWIIDQYFLSFTLIVTFGQQMLGFIMAATCKFDTVTDLFYGTNFFILAITTLFINRTFFVRQLVISGMVMAWGARLSLYLFYRIVKIGTDKRFDEWREKPALLFRFWFLQFLAIWLIFLPIAFIMADTSDSPLLVSDYVGWGMWVIGFVVEWWADQVKFAFRNDASNKGKWCDAGPWRWSRHPNYFGEMMMWWGIWMSCASTFVFVNEPAKFASAVSPIFITVTLLFLSGITRLEEATDKRYGTRADYLLYKKRTSVLIPLPPGCFGGCPQALKCCCCCEWGIYNYLSEQQTGDVEAREDLEYTSLKE